MSYPLGVFYVYVQDSAGTSVVTFTSHESANKWWRALQPARFGEQWGIKRISPQHYLITGSARGAWQSILQPEFIIPPVITASQRTIPPYSGHTEYLNGRAYCVSSSGRPGLFWFVDDTMVRCSMQHTRLFLIQRAKSLPYHVEPDEDILIDTDEVNIFVVNPRKEDGQGVMIIKRDIGAGNMLRLELLLQGSTELVSEEMSVFEFGKFKGGFYAESGYIYEANSAFGDHWELK